MFRRLTLWLVVVFISLFPGICEEVAYVFGEDGSYPLDHSSISEYNGSDIIMFTVADGPDGSGPTSKTIRTVDSIKEDFEKRVEVDNAIVVNEAAFLASEYPGDYSIEQICSIYNYIENNWIYVRDPRGEDYYRYANETLQLGKRRDCAGVGDCDDFAILMSALIEDIGGSTRIILAYGPGGGHAYPEVYLGKVGAEDQRVERIIDRLRDQYDIAEGNTHKDLKTDEVWLNLDWGNDPKKGSYPGGPFYTAEKHVVLHVRDVYDKSPVTPPNEPPLAIIKYEPEEPSAGEKITFNASQSHDPYGAIIGYDWDFGDGTTAEGSLVEHAYSEGGVFTVNLTVIDDDGAKNFNFSKIQVNKLPIAQFNHSIQKLGEGYLITFNASESRDEDGWIENYEWNFGDGEKATGISKIRDHYYPACGIFTVNLTITDDTGAKDSKSIPIKINEPPVPRFSYNPKESNAGDKITFDASQSWDNDGNIVKYLWYFGDGVTKEGVSVVHDYSTGGTFPVKLEVRDDDNSTNSTSKAIRVNALPVADFTYEPKMPKLDEKITFDASKSRDDDGEIVDYEWDFGDGYPTLKGKRQTHSYSLNGSFTVTLTITDDKDAKSSYTTKIIIGPIITSHKDGDKVARVTTLMGECPQEIGEAVWIFVANKPPLVEEILYYPQSMNPSIGESTPKINGKWEMGVGFGSTDPNHVEKPFDILLTVADEQASQSISDYLIRCHENNSTYIGLEDLPKGVIVVERIEVVRTEVDIGSPPDISNVQLSGQASIDVQNGASANESMYISGEYTPEVKDHIWVLVRPSWGRWYPQSIDPSSERYEGHTDMIEGEWSTRCQFGDNQTEKGEPFDIVMVLADEDASANFVEFQNECYKNNETYLGLLTIELPRGIDEKDRVRVYRDLDQTLTKLYPSVPIVLNKWNQTFGGSGNESGKSVRETNDSGYIIAGYTTSYGSGERDVWLIKTDSSGNEVWNSTFGGLNWDEGRSVRETKDKGYVITGYTYSYGSGGADIWVIKTDFDGIEEWNKTFGGSNSEEGFSVQETNDRGYIVIGASSSHDPDNWDVWLIKTDSDGNEEWNRTFGGSSFDSGHTVQHTLDGGYIIIGETNSYDVGDGDFWLIKTDSDGNEKWNRTFGGPYNDEGESVHATIDGGYIIAGKTWSHDSGNWDFWLIKTDSDGNEKWSRIFDGSGDDESRFVQQTGDGGYIIAGQTKSDISDEGRIWLVKTDPTGNMVWNRTFGGSSGDEGYSVQETSDGGYIIAGQTTSYGAGGKDVWLIKTDSFGLDFEAYPDGIILYDDAQLYNWRYVVGNAANIADPLSTNNSKSGNYCAEIRYEPSNGNEWDAVVIEADGYLERGPGIGEDLTGVKKLVFWARGKEGGENVEFGYGYCDDGRGSSDSTYEKRIVTLAEDWQKYEFDLAGKDLSHINCLLICVTQGKQAITFYLDDIKYIY